VKYIRLPELLDKSAFAKYEADGSFSQADTEVQEDRSVDSRRVVINRTLRGKCASCIGNGISKAKEGIYYLLFPIFP
jgi:hypothetical protein